MKKTIYHISRIFVGLVFTFSGFVKAVDPMGTSIKFSDYFNYAFDLPMFSSMSLPLALFMCALELLLGILLILNYLPKFSAFWSVLLMAVFTPLTLYLAIANPVSDCGCFGDAVKLSNWQTFWKNIVIDIFLIFIVVWYKKFPPKLKLKTRQIAAVIIGFIVFGFELYNYSYLPIIDFRPYKVGNNISELMSLPDGVEEEPAITTFVYKNSQSGELKEFSQDNYPWDDSTWVWVETKTETNDHKLVPKIHDFDITDLNDVNITNEILESEDTVILIVTYTLEKAKLKHLEKIKSFVDSFIVNRPSTKIYCITSSNNDKILNVKQELNVENWTFCKIDEVTSKTIIRSNPGIVFLHSGTVLKKLHHHSLNKKNLSFR